LQVRLIFLGENLDLIHVAFTVSLLVRVIVAGESALWDPHGAASSAPFGMGISFIFTLCVEASLLWAAQQAR